MLNQLQNILPETCSIDIRMQSPLTLAYIGDSVIDLLIRTYLASTCRECVNQLNKRAIQVVSAGAQAQELEEISSMLTEEELDIVGRGRNAKSGRVPKNAAVGEYKLATGLEALFGYLFLMGREERLCQLFAEIVDKRKFDVLGKELQ